MEQSTEPQRIKERCLAARGYWRPLTDAIVDRHPDYLEHYAVYASQSVRSDREHEGVRP